MDLNKIKQFNEKAWSSKGIFKFTHPDNLPSNFLTYPKYFGYAWIDWGKNRRLRAMFTLIPLNWFFRKIRNLYIKLKFGNSAEYGQMVYAKNIGFKEGIETAIAITNQFSSLQEIKNHLRNCL